MTNGIRAQRRAIFVREMITAETLEDQIAAYKKAFPQCKSDDSARAASYRLLQEVEVKEAIEAGKHEREDMLAAARKDEAVRLARREIAHELQIDAKLTAIAMGTYRRKRKVPVFNKASKKFEIVTIEEEPTEADMIAAADKLYKRKGSYAPKEIKHEGGDSFLDFMKSIATMSNPNIPNGVPPATDNPV